MKKKIFSLVCLLSLVLCGCSNSNSLEQMSLIDLNKYNASVNDDYEYSSLQLEKYLELTQGLNRSQVIEMINILNNEVVKSNVLITNEVISSKQKAVLSGSGSVIKETSNKYYILTNNHVIHGLGHSLSFYHVYDYLNNKYEAKLEYANDNYDMAILSFNKASSNLRVASISETDPKIKENIITIGQPLGKRNSITFGEVIKYDKVDCPNCASTGSNVKYDCVYYDAFTNNGNSGGMLLNYNYEIVAITTFGLKSMSGSYISGAGSSASKIREFLNLFETIGGGYDE